MSGIGGGPVQGQQVWPYDKDIPFVLGRVSGWFHIAYKRLEPMRGKDDTELKNAKGWVRLVTWNALNPSMSSSHVNIDSDLKILVRAALQWFYDAGGAKYGIFLVNHDPERIEIAPSSALAPGELWPDDISPPKELLGQPGSGSGRGGRQRLTGLRSFIGTRIRGALDSQFGYM